MGDGTGGVGDLVEGCRVGQVGEGSLGEGVGRGRGGGWHWDGGRRRKGVEGEGGRRRRCELELSLLSSLAPPVSPFGFDSAVQIEEGKCMDTKRERVSRSKKEHEVGSERRSKKKRQGRERWVTKTEKAVRKTSKA